MIALSYLHRKPKLDKLCEFIRTTKWMELGIQLELDPQSLDEIDEDNRKVSGKITKVFRLWLDSAPRPTVGQMLSALRSTSVCEHAIADKYESFCKTCTDLDTQVLLSPTSKRKVAMQHHWKKTSDISDLNILEMDLEQSTENSLGNINAVIVAALLLEAFIIILIFHYLGILWIPFILVLTVILSHKCMRIKDQPKPSTPDQQQEKNISIEIPECSQKSNSLAVKNVKLIINVQSSSKIIAVNESPLPNLEYLTFPNKYRFSVLLKLLELKSAAFSNLLPYTVKIHEEGVCRTQSTCYVSVTVHACPLSSNIYSELQRFQDYYLQQKIHKEAGLTCLDFSFIKPETEYMITFGLVSVIDESGRDIVVHCNENTCSLQTVSESKYQPDIQPARLKFTGPLQRNKYTRLTETYRKMILSGNTDHVRKITKQFLKSSEPCDIKVVALIHSGFSHQTKSYKTTNCFNDSKRELDKALKMCQQSDCENTDLLTARTFTFMAQNYIFAKCYEEAWRCISDAKTAFFYAAECTEMSGIVYQEVMILSIEFDVIGDQQKRKLQELIGRAIGFARLGTDYQAMCLTAFMLIKKAMLHLGIFNLVHLHFQGTMSVEDFTPSHEDCLEARNSLFEVPQEYIQDPTVSCYKALYYFALSDYHRHAGNITEGRNNLIFAETQVRNGNFDFPLKEIEMRRTFFSKVCPTTNDSIQDIFDNFVIQT